MFMLVASTAVLCLTCGAVSQMLHQLLTCFTCWQHLTVKYLPSIHPSHAHVHKTIKVYGIMPSATCSASFVFSIVTRSEVYTPYHYYKLDSVGTC